MSGSAATPRLSSALDTRTAEALAGLDDLMLGEGLAELRRQIDHLETQRLRNRPLVESRNEPPELRGR